jgi:uncharacterized membrane protein YoaK (UPF0700 family)
MVLTRLAWFLLIGIAIFGAFQSIVQWRIFAILIFYIVYFNVMYALVSHAEARYMLPVLPFYFLFFALGIQRLNKDTI